MKLRVQAKGDLRFGISERLTSWSRAREQEFNLLAHDTRGSSSDSGKRGSGGS